MAEIAFSLPEELAQQAREAGLLEPEQIERLLLDEIERRKQGKWPEILRELSERPEPDGMSMQEIAEEVRAVRAERHAQAIR